MYEMTQEQRARFEQLCRQYHVRRIDLFGSAARDDFDAERSDLDFLVEHESDPPIRALDMYFGFKDDLEKLFGRSVDLVMDGAVRNPYILADMKRSRRQLYAA
ncbi:MAG TPA: nucleotidyltransferase domain-containing protein [Gemmatimonadaceae bacterium]